MLRSLYSGVSGLRSHQTMMDVVGNNIANVNTAGYKGSSVVFEDVLSQTLQGAAAPQDGRGGANPAQVGLGVRVGAISPDFGQGSLQRTGKATDLAIQGEGFFAVRTGDQTLYTRAGAFDFDRSGALVTSSGATVQGWPADVNGVIDTNGAAGDLRLPIGTVLPPEQTESVRLGGNLPADAEAGDVITTSITVYDDQGAAHDLAASFTRGTNDPADWSVAIAVDGGAPGTPTTVTWDEANNAFTGTLPTVTVAGSPNPITLEMGTPDEPMTGYAGDNSLGALEQDGSAMGTLSSFAISPDGTVVGVFSNGLRQQLGQIALGTFTNPGGLEKVGESMYRATVNSGAVQVGTAGDGGAGTLTGGSLEMSNVDLAREFTNLIVAQRGFQANSRVITASDELLQNLVNMTR